MSLYPVFNPPSAPTEQQKSEVESLRYWNDILDSLGTPSLQSKTPVAGAPANENATAGKRLLLQAITSFETLDELLTRIEVIAGAVERSGIGTTVLVGGTAEGFNRPTWHFNNDMRAQSEESHLLVQIKLVYDGNADSSMMLSDVETFSAKTATDNGLTLQNLNKPGCNLGVKLVPGNIIYFLLFIACSAVRERGASNSDHNLRLTGTDAYSNKTDESVPKFELNPWL